MKTEIDLKILWDVFVTKTIPKDSLERPKNFLGSVEKHKKMFFEAVKELQNK